MKQKTIIAIGCVILVLIVVALGTALYMKLHQSNGDGEQEQTEAYYPGEKGVLIFREKDPTDIIWKGKKYQYPNRYPFDFSVPVRYESNLSKSILNIRKGYNRALIILSDRDGNLDVSTEELDNCILRAVESRRYYFLYLGSARIGEIIEILRNHVDLSAANFDYEGSAAIGILQLSDGSIRIVLNAVIDESAPEDDGWIWEYIAVNAGMGMFDGSYFDD